MSLVIRSYKKNLLKRYDKDGAIPYLSYQDFPGLHFEEYSFINSVGTKISYFYYNYDNPKPNKVVVFCHGIGPGHTAYLAEIEALCKNGYKVLTLDYTGCDRSGGDEMDSMNTPTRDVIDLLRHLNLKDEIILIGHSLGGYTALNVINKLNFIHKAVVISGFISLKYEAKTLAKLSAFANEILKYEKKTNPEYFGIDNISYLKTTTDKLLFIQSKDDFLVDYKTGLKEVKSFNNPNITCVSEEGKKHNPTYTKEAVELMTKTINEYNSLINNKKLDTLEKRKEFFKDITAFDMTVQDPRITKIIISFLEGGKR